MPSIRRSLAEWPGKLKNQVLACKWNLLALLVIACVLSFHISEKEGYHMDELLSFELANAEFTPWIVPTQPEGRLAKFVREEVRDESFGKECRNVIDIVGDVIRNKGNSRLAGYQADVYEEPVWISKAQFQDYVTVDKQDAFNYLSVYFNVKDDNHPPLHFMLLHTMSSLFRNRIYPWLGCFLNLAAVLGTCILLMKMGELVWKSRLCGIAAALLYGLSAGGIATVLLIRMYGLMTFFCMAALYIHLKKWQEGSWRTHNAFMISITVLGFLTQYFFLFYVITLAAVVIITLLAEKRGKEALCYIRSMAAAAVTGIAVFPFAVQDVFASGRGVEALEKLQNGFEGYGARLAAFGQIVAKRFAGGYIGLLLIALILFAGFVWIRRREPSPGRVVYVMLTVPVVCYFLLAAKLSPYLVDRYIMALFPAVALLAAGLLKQSGIPGKVYLPVVLLTCLAGVVSYDGEYLYKGYESQKETAESYREYPCLCLYDGVGYYENLIEFCQYERTLLVTWEELQGRSEDPVLTDSGELIVLVKTDNEKQLLTLLQEKYGFSVEKELLTDSVYHDKVWLCKKEK